MSENKENSNLSTSPASPVEGAFRLPSKSAISAARKRRDKVAADTSSTPHGTVVGLDVAEWSTAIIDMALSDVRRAYYRTRYADKGYVLLEGSPTVIGYDRGAEVWIKPIEDRVSAVRERRAVIEDHVARGRMHRSALGGNVHVQKLLGPRAN
tara:strand:+ start:545 stop:1003 length:459 start_codon:yes stop_codon:yes gene_type:complete